MNKLFLLILAGCLLIFPLVASAHPSEAKLSFDYTSLGTLKIDVKFDEVTDSRCIARHRVSLYYEDDQFGVDSVLRKSSHSRVVDAGRTSTSLRASGLKGVKQKNGKDPILAVQVRLVCSGEQDVTSNVEARYIRCGDTTKRLSTTQYLKDLKKKLAKSK